MSFRNGSELIINNLSMSNDVEDIKLSNVTQDTHEELSNFFDNIQQYSNIEKNKMSHLLKKNRKELFASGLSYERSSGDVLIRKTLDENKKNILNQIAQENKNIIKNSDMNTKRALIEKLKHFNPFIKKEFEKYTNRIGINYTKYLELNDHNLKNIPESFWIAIIQGLIMESGYEKNLGYHKNTNEEIRIDGSFGPNTLYTLNEIYDHINQGKYTFSGILNEGNGKQTILEFLLGENNKVNNIINTQPKITHDNKRNKEPRKFHPINGQPDIIYNGFAIGHFEDLLEKYGSSSKKSNQKLGYKHLIINNNEEVQRALITADKEKKELHFKFILNEGKYGSEQNGSIKYEDNPPKLSIYSKKIQWINSNKREYITINQIGEEGNYKKMKGQEAEEILRKIKSYGEKNNNNEK